MNRISPILKILAVCICLTVLLTVSLVGVARTAREQRRSLRLINAVSPVGITAGQTLHITFLNTGDDPFEIIPCVFEARGTEVKEGMPMTLVPGEIASFDVSWSELGTRLERRVQLRAVAHVSARDLKHLLVNAEVVDDETGKTSVFAPGSRVGFDPQPDPPVAK